MNPERTQLKQQQRTDQAAAQEQVHASENQSQTREFATVEALLRHDSEANPVPPEVADRLGRTLEAEPKPVRPWYKKLFG